MRMKHGLAIDQPVVLVSAGGFGVTNIEHIVEALTHVKQRITIVALCGSNTRAADVLKEKYSSMEHHSVHVVGYTTEMDEYMSAADIMIGKPGGLTSSEVLAKQLPLIIVNPLPGQEERNADYLLEQGAAWKCNNIPTLPYKVELLLSSESSRTAMKNAAASIARPRAAGSVADAVQKMFG